MEKLGISDGIEIEISKNERDEIVLRPAQIGFNRTRQRTRMSEIFFPDLTCSN
ncbi:MAG: hypothetical protein ACR2HG_12840 [Pyrinomonadaceae bacterium]